MFRSTCSTKSSGWVRSLSRFFSPWNSYSLRNLSIKWEDRDVNRYRNLAVDENANGANPEIAAIMKQLGYTNEMIDSVPIDATIGTGCGAPHKYVSLKPGMKSLDIGCGRGCDTILCALSIQSNNGYAIGLDILPEMIQKAKENAENTKGLDLNCIDFYVGNANDGYLMSFDSPIASDSLDLVTTNCCLCLLNESVVIPHIYNVLKKGGAFSLSESMVEKPFPQDLIELVRILDKGKFYTKNNDVSAKYLRAIITHGYENAMTKDKVLKRLKESQFSSVEVVCSLNSPIGLSQMPISPPEITSDIWTQQETNEFIPKFNKIWNDHISNIDDHIQYISILTTK